MHANDNKHDTHICANIILRVNCNETENTNTGPECHHPILIGQQNVGYVWMVHVKRRQLRVRGEHNRRINFIFHRLRPNTINLIITPCMHITVATSMANYACEPGKRTAMIAYRLDAFYGRCQSIIFDISLVDDVTNEEVMRRAGIGYGTRRVAQPLSDQI